MLCVVLQHTMLWSTANFQNEFLFQFVWTLQLPLFMLISGYVTRYTKSINSRKALWFFFKKRTFAYLLPWSIWSFLIRGLILGKYSYLDIKWLLWHMDSGYWFLITIWSISIVYGLVDYISNIIAHTKYIHIISHIILFCISLIILWIIGYVLGLNFLCIKLTLYYLPIYLLGYLYGQFQDWLLKLRYFELLNNLCLLVCFGSWIALITRFDFFGVEDTIFFILFRYFTSIIGCITICSLFTGNTVLKECNLLRWTGVHSLEIYLTHYLFLNLIKDAPSSSLQSMNGFILLVVNFTLTILFTITLIRVLQQNSTLNYLLYGKRSF